ncbi:MAG: hypothetical protein ACRCWG_03245 [Sarcina sp.]
MFKGEGNSKFWFIMCVAWVIIGLLNISSNRTGFGVFYLVFGVLAFVRANKIRKVEKG